MNISRSQAICMLFCEEYSEENAARLSKKIEDFGPFDVCYQNDPKQPVLMHLCQIRGDPFTFKRYLIKCSAPNFEEPTHVNPELVSESEVVSFLNQVYCTAINLQNEDVYSLKYVNIKDIYKLTISKTERMNKKSEISFATWCSKKKVNFMNAPFTRKRNRESNKRYRKLYVMKDEYIDSIVETFVNHIPRYQDYINSLKKQKCTIIGYARKSPRCEDDEKRKELLNRMVRCLKDRSLCDMVFVSPSCLASDSLASRDLSESANSSSKLGDIDGDTQAMVSCINTSKKDICLVAIDFAGLSTNLNDLQTFIR